MPLAVLMSMPGMGPCGMDDLRIGDRIILDGRSFVLLGFDPMSMPERTAQLQDTETGAISRVPVAYLSSHANARTGAAPGDPQTG